MLFGEREGCVVVMFTEAENGTFPEDVLNAISRFEKLINHKIGSVVWFPA